MSGTILFPSSPALAMTVVISLWLQVVGGGRLPVLFNFGDSNSDTGGAAAAFGYRLPLPIGRLHFNRSTGRVGDGRLVVDFLCESLNASYLSPYLDSLEPDFRNGANFAVGGASTQPIDRAFSLHYQVNQFVRYKSRSLQLVTQGSKNLIGEESFGTALYMIDIGQNDLEWSGTSSYDQLILRIPLILSEIELAIQTLYSNGAKKFWIHNTGPLGCLPQKLATTKTNDVDLDPFGCIMHLNSVAKKLNDGLSALCDEMNYKLNNALVVYIDVYAIKYDLIANSTKYGFDKPLMACCGHGGPPYNFDSSTPCGGRGCQVCPEGSKSVSWDGVHYTEAANNIVATSILSANYSKPRVRFDLFCTD